MKRRKLSEIEYVKQNGEGGMRYQRRHEKIKTGMMKELVVYTWERIR